jgi:hypothetical protein
MNTTSSKIGFWSALTMLITFVTWIICFVGIAATSPLFIWSDLGSYIEYYRSNDQLFQNIAKASMLVFGPAYIILLNSFHETVSENRKQLTRLGLLFGLLFTALSSVHYFVQLSAVRLNLDKGITDSMEHLVQANPLSVMTSIDMLGWTLFLGLSSLFMFSSFKGLQRWISIGFLINGISCILAMVGYLFQIDILTFTCINLGVGGAMILVSITSLNHFHFHINHRCQPNCQNKKPNFCQ